DQAHLPRIRHKHFVPHRCQVPAHPRRMCPHFQCDPARRHLGEQRIQSRLCGWQLIFARFLSRLIQNAIAARAVSEVQPHGQPLFCCRWTDLALAHLQFRNAILLHKPVSFCTSSSASIGILKHPRPWGTGLLIPSLSGLAVWCTPGFLRLAGIWANHLTFMSRTPSTPTRAFISAPRPAKIGIHHMVRPTPPAPGDASRYLPLLVVLFAGSGCSALIYETVWYQLLQLAIGSTAVSLGGLCIGSVWFPRMRLAGQHPLRIYAYLELGIAGCALLVHLVLPLVNMAYIAGAEHGMPGFLLRGFLAAICLLQPTVLM